MLPKLLENILITVAFGALIAVTIVAAVDAWDTECDIREAKAQEITRGMAK